MKSYKYSLCFADPMQPSVVFSKLVVEIRRRDFKLVLKFPSCGVGKDKKIKNLSIKYFTQESPRHRQRNVEHIPFSAQEYQLISKFVIITCQTIFCEKREVFRFKVFLNMFNYESDHLKSVQLTSTPPLRFVPVSYIIYHQEAILKKIHRYLYSIFSTRMPKIKHILIFPNLPLSILFSTSFLNPKKLAHFKTSEL